MSKAVTRIQDSSVGHCFNPRGNIEGSPTVFVNGRAVHRLGDSWPSHSCPPNSHASITSEGSSTVFINGVACARIGDSLDCGDMIAEGSPDVFAGG
jgi:uncharacterized Zn-binding protein involved in type VI secretion